MNIFLFETTTFNNQVSAEEKHELKLQNKKSYIDGTSRKKKKKKTITPNSVLPPTPIRKITTKNQSQHLSQIKTPHFLANDNINKIQAYIVHYSP